MVTLDGSAAELTLDNFLSFSDNFLCVAVTPQVDCRLPVDHLLCECSPLAVTCYALGLYICKSGAMEDP